MLRKTPITTLAISAAAVAPAAARPSDVMGLDPAANGVRLTDTAPIPVSTTPARSLPDTRTASLRLEPGASFATELLVTGSELAEAAERFEATHLYATGAVSAALVRRGSSDEAVDLDLTLVGRGVDRSAPAS